MPNVNIGNHCVIGAGSLVNKNMPSFSVAFGYPAKIVGKVIWNGDKYDITYYNEILSIE